MNGDWSGPLDDAALDEIEAVTRAEQEAALAALLDARRLQLDAELGQGWCLANPVVLAVIVQRVQEQFREIVEASWTDFHAARAAGFPDVWPPPLH
jgi:hypothetical protein